MNKKLVLSVLSTAVLTSMAASAMAKPSQGFYVGGEVDKYYSPTALLADFKAGLKEILSNATDTVYVNKDGKAANFLVAAEAEKMEDVLKPATRDLFEENDYAVVGSEGEKWNPADEDDWPVPGDITVESVSAINGIEVFAATADQAVGFTINGKTEAADLTAVEAAGYTVEFSASKAVFADASGNPTFTNSTGKLLATLTAGTSFDYQVVVKKEGNVVAQSDFATVKVVSPATVKEITAVATTASINGVDNVVLASNVISIASDSNVTLDATEGTTADGKTKQAVNGETFKSLDQTVALINATTGKITPVKAGTVTFEITAGTATKQVTYTIVNEARTVKSATADVSEIKLTNNNAGKTVTLTVKDQFGDAAVVDLPAIAAVKNSSDEEITVAADPEVTNKSGVTTFNVKPVAGKQGSGTLQVKDRSGNVLVSIQVTVGDGSVVASRKLETDAADNVIDPYNEEDNEISLTFNQYNAAGLLIGAETNIDDASKGDVENPTYLVISDKETVATVAVNAQGTIVIKAVGAGEATISVKEGALTRASYKVVVNDSTPTVTAVTFDANAKVTAAGDYALANVIKGLKTAAGVDLYLQGDGSINTKEDGSGVKVGSVKFVSGDFASVIVADGNIKYGTKDDEASPAAGDSGTIAINVLDKAGNVVDTFVLNVEVPEADPQV